MTRGRTSLPIAILLALIIGGVVWFLIPSGSPKAPPPLPPRTNATVEKPKLDPAAPPVSSRETASQATPPSAAAEKPPALGQVLTGRVLLKDDSSPVANAAVKLVVDRSKTSFDTHTDTRGAFRFELEQPCSVRGLRILATPNTTALSAWNDDAFPPGGESERTFFVTRGATLSGTVVDRSGAPVVGADVTAWCTQNYPKDSPPDRTTKSAAGGRFTLAHLGESFFVAASAPDQCCARGLRGKLVPGTSADGLEIVVAPCVTVRGHVVEDELVPLAGATLRMDGGNSSSVDDNTLVPGVTRCDWGAADLKSDAQGAFEIVGLPGPQFRRNVWVEHETCVGTDAPLDSKVPDNLLVLKRGVEVNGIVFRPNRIPAANAQVVIGHVGGRIRTVTTAANGTFRALGVSPEKTMVFRVHMPGEAIYACNVGTEGGSIGMQIDLEPAKSLAGVVIDEEGKLVPFAKVHIEGDRRVTYADFGFGEPTTVEFAHDMQNTVADAAGEFRIDDLYDGVFEIRATDPEGIVGSGKISSRSGVEDLIVAFDPAQTTGFVGRVVDDVTGDPIREFHVTCMKPQRESPGDWSGKTKKFSTTDGRFRYGGVEIGMAELRVSVDGYAQLTSGAQKYGPGPQEVEARMVPVRTLSLEITRADGRRPEGISISASDADGKTLQLDTGPGSTTSKVHVNAAEPVQLAGLPARPIIVHVTADDETFDFDFDLRVPIDTPQRVVLKTVPEVDVHVTFLDSRGKSVFSFPPPFVQDDVELILEDARGQRLSKIQVKPTFKAFEITTQTGRNSTRATRGEAVVRVSVRSTVAIGKLRVGGRAPIQLTVPAPTGDLGIQWLIDVSKY